MKSRSLELERLEQRQMLTAAVAAEGWHNAAYPEDVDLNRIVTPIDALLVVNKLGDEGALPAAPVDNEELVDVDANGSVNPMDALLVVNELNAPLSGGTGDHPGHDFEAMLSKEEAMGAQNLLTTTDVETLLTRASEATPSEDAIIAIVDRTGRILGVRVEDGVDVALRADSEQLSFAIDGAVAKARTAAYFSSNAAPLTSRTVRFISQSTITQREVESSPTHADDRFRGPGFVAPIGVGGHFPPEIPFTPQVDLFAIEHQSRDSQFHQGSDTELPFTLVHRFNANPTFIPTAAEEFFATWPEPYGVATADSDVPRPRHEFQSRGIATLPGGIPLYKVVTDAEGVVQQRPNKTPSLPDINLVGGIGVFFPGPDGFATHEQGFEHAADRGPGEGPQTERQRTNADRVLESEFIALAAAAGGGLVGPPAFTRNLTEFNNELAPLSNFVVPAGRIDLVGLTLEIFGPTPSTQNPVPGIDRLIGVGRNLRATGPSADSGSNFPVDATGATALAGQAVPEGWLVAPHDAPDDPTTPEDESTILTAERVKQIIAQGVDEARLTRAAIRLDIDNNFRPGPRTGMVLAVSDRDGNLLGLFRMPDATVFSIDVSIAKARNTAYYADASDLAEIDRIDFDGDGVAGPTTQNRTQFGDTVPSGTALTNRTFRFLVEPRYPTGIELPADAGDGLVATRGLCEQKADICQLVGPQSILRLPGINPKTAENVGAPQPFDVYASESTPSFLAFDAFNVMRNFRDAGDSAVVIFGSDDGTGAPIRNPLANQNGIVFFPGSAPLYVGGQLVGGFGVSGDGVDQDDVVTVAGFTGFGAPTNLQVDQYFVGGLRLPYVKFNRNPRGD